MKIERELMRGAGPLAVMKLLERGEMYGYELVDALSKRSDGLFSMGQSTLYPLLYNLEAKGLIEAQWREATSERPRKYYRLTSKGRTRLREQTDQWQTVTKAMQMLGVVNPPRAEGQA